METSQGAEAWVRGDQEGHLASETVAARLVEAALHHYRKKTFTRVRYRIGTRSLSAHNGESLSIQFATNRPIENQSVTWVREVSRSFGNA